MYELIAIWFFTIALLNLSTILIVKTRPICHKSDCKDFVLVDYHIPVIKPIQRPDRTDNVLLLDDPDSQECLPCPKCHQFNLANPELDTLERHLKYKIPLVAKHKYRGANINALCQICVDKIHKEIDNALDGPLDKPVEYGGYYHYNGRSDNLELEFEILIDGKSVYKGYDYRMIKQVMGKTKAKPDKYVTSWLSIADIRQTDRVNYRQSWLINGNTYSKIDGHEYDGYIAKAMPKLIAGLKAQGKEYVISESSDYKGRKRYIVLERIANKESVTVS